MKPLILLSIISFVLLLVFWCIQFLKLMQMKSDDFSSREDKIIWAVAFFLTGALGAFLFWIYFKPTPDMPPPPEIILLDDAIYSDVKRRFPEQWDEVDKTLQLPSYERSSMENYFSRKKTSALLADYQKGPSKMRTGCYGILLAVLTARKINIENP